MNYCLKCGDQFNDNDTTKITRTKKNRNLKISLCPICDTECCMFVSKNELEGKGFNFAEMYPFGYSSPQRRRILREKYNLGFK